MSRPLVLCLALCLCGIAPPAAATPNTLAVEGALRSIGGGPVADGKYSLVFRLYASMTAETALWKEIHLDIPVTGGGFRVVVGAEEATNPLGAALFGKHPNAAIGVQVSTEPELPRVALHAVPYALHAATADELTGGLDGKALGPGSVQAYAVGFTYAGSDAKAGPALGLKCTGCITAGHLADGVLAAKNIAFADGAQPTVQDTLWPLQNALSVAGKRVGLGKAPANACALDVASSGGAACIDGVPALWTRIAASDQDMTALATPGQLVYRKDQQKAWMYAGTAWREVAFKATCGDGVAEAPEQCDDGAQNADVADKCRKSCMKPACGDSILDKNEVCDDGNDLPIDGCVACKKAACGDGFLQVGVEECDDGANNADAPDKCRKICKKPACGDAILDKGETCDDGNKVDDDVCSNACVPLLPANKLVPGNTTQTIEAQGHLIRCLEWSGKTCMNAQIAVKKATCGAYTYADQWHSNVYGNDSEKRNCPNWCALATGGNTNFVSCSAGSGVVTGPYRACAMSTSTTCSQSVYTWKTDYANQNGQLHVYLGDCYGDYPKVAVQCSGW